DAEEDVAQAELHPAREDLPVAQQDVGAGLQVVALADAASFDGVGDRHAMLGTDEGHVVHDEDVRLADARQVVGRCIRGRLAVATAVEGPGAAEGAVPGTAACELDRRARIELAAEVCNPLRDYVPGPPGR